MDPVFQRQRLGRLRRPHYRPGTTTPPDGLFREMFRDQRERQPFTRRRSINPDAISTTPCTSASSTIISVTSRTYRGTYRNASAAPVIDIN